MNNNQGSIKDNADTTEESCVIDKSGYEEYHAPPERKNMRQEEDRTDPGDGDFCLICKIVSLTIIAIVAYGLIQILNSPLFPLRG